MVKPSWYWGATSTDTFCSSTWVRFPSLTARTVSRYRRATASSLRVDTCTVSTTSLGLPGSTETSSWSKVVNQPTGVLSTDSETVSGPLPSLATLRMYSPTPPGGIGGRGPVAAASMATEYANFWVTTTLIVWVMDSGDSMGPLLRAVRVRKYSPLVVVASGTTDRTTVRRMSRDRLNSVWVRWICQSR